MGVPPVTFTPSVLFVTLALVPVEVAVIGMLLEPATTGARIVKLLFVSVDTTVPATATVPGSLRLPLIINCPLPLTLVTWFRSLYAALVTVSLICWPRRIPAASYR